MANAHDHYSVKYIEARILAGLRAAGLNPEQRLSPEDLGALDHFHTGGLRASHELMDMVPISAKDRVLDIGAGLAGSARLLASSIGCGVDCVELSFDYCAGAALLNRITGLEDQIRIRQGSALSLPYPDAVFDVVWMQNVGMNIPDKSKLYAEIARVLRRGGRYAFQEIASGTGATTYFPLPWAGSSDDHFLLSAEEIRASLYRSGFLIERFDDFSDLHQSRTTADAGPLLPGQLGLAVFVDNLAVKSMNARRSLEEGQIRLVRGVFQKK